MACKKCTIDPVISRRYSGEVLCERCFFKSFEKNAIKELRSQINLLIQNSDIKIKKIGIGLSGGKDSTVALKILDYYSRERDVELIGLSVDEGPMMIRKENVGMFYFSKPEIVIICFEEIISPGSSPLAGVMTNGSILVPAPPLNLGLEDVFSGSGFG